MIGVVSFAVMLAMLFLYLFKSNARRISMIVVVISLLFVILANVSAAALSGSGDELPEGMTKSQVQYALINYWAGEVVKIENAKAANQYRKA